MDISRWHEGPISKFLQQQLITVEKIPNRLFQPAIQVSCKLTCFSGTSHLVSFLLLLSVCVGLVGCASPTPPQIDISQATYAGSDSCLECHQQQVQLHAGSHHDLAMQIATEETVLADFNDATLMHHGISSRMYRQNGNFMVETEGPDGQLHQYQVKYVFGLTPLQQYMVEFADTPDNQSQSGLPRIQVLPVCWDTANGTWFYLDPPDIDQRLSPQDDLHWTGIAQRWNTMCAECHSTNYRRNFTPGVLTNFDDHAPETVNLAGSAIGHYQSEFSEINVACESCHGPASVHIAMARSNPRWNRETGFGLADLKKSSEHQIQACAPCHSRRGVMYPGFDAGHDYFDYHQLSLLTWPTYYPDGQVLDENYVFGSFVQSKMYHKGIRCTDCHDPHTARLKHEGNQVCTSCHQHPAAKYDTPSHHFHQPGSEGAQCVNCHMPSTTYMKVDARRDHSLRIPRPDMSLQMNTPNACTGCHLKQENVASETRPKLKLYQDWMKLAREGETSVAAEVKRVDEWCNEACERWYGSKRRKEPHWGLALAAGQSNEPDAASKLTSVIESIGELSPFLARATAVHVLFENDSREAGLQASKIVDDANPVVRAAAAFALRGHENRGRATELLETLLRDRSRLVRFEAARSLLELPPHHRSPAGSNSMGQVLNELAEGLAYNNDRSGSHLSLGSIAEQSGSSQQAIAHYERALVVEPAAVGARTNLAALLSRQLEENPSLPSSVRDSLVSKISLMRSQELKLLERDVGLLPNPPSMLVFRYGLALYLDGQLEKAAEQIVRAAEIQSDDSMLAESSAEIFEKLGRKEDALRWAQEAVRRSGGSPQSKAILSRIQSQ